MFFLSSSAPALKKKHLYYLTIFSTVLFSSWNNMIFAQVSVNNSALNNLGPAKNIQPKSTKNKKATSISKHTKQPTNPAKISQSKPKQTQAAIPSIPNSPPPNPVFRDPELNVPLHPPASPAMPKINPKAQGNVVVNYQHTIINFKGDESELNEIMMKTVMDMANILKRNPNVQIYLNAYSHGTVDDISTPRRNALNRGLTIRAVLINQGIPATRIYLIAKGIPESNTNANPDYVEMVRSDLVKDKK